MSVFLLAKKSIMVWGLVRRCPVDWILRWAILRLFFMKMFWSCVGPVGFWGGVCLCLVSGWVWLGGGVLCVLGICLECCWGQHYLLYLQYVFYLDM